MKRGGAIETLREYHERTKHHFNRYAASPGGLDWATQPDPFRRFEGAPRADLPLAADDIKTTYHELFRRPVEEHAVKPDIRTVAALFELSLGLSAWKSFGPSRWALRCNPSSGNLHPTEGYLITGDISGLNAGVYHYSAYEHALEKRLEPSESFKKLCGGLLIVGLSSIHWREEWKYGERAYRYCQLDVGHALAAIGFAAATLGWSARAISDAADTDAAALMGVDRDKDFADAERETADILILIGARRGEERNISSKLIKQLASEARRGAWKGAANVLSATHSDNWPAVEKASMAAVKPETSETQWRPQGVMAAPPELVEKHVTASALIRRRRSGQAYDRSTKMPAETFHRTLFRVTPNPDMPPWNTAPWTPLVNLFLFVHRVEGYEQGLYAFIRDKRTGEKLRKAVRSEFEWIKPNIVPDGLPLYRLGMADMQDIAMGMSCHQDIASDGAFMAVMLAEFDEALKRGAWWYRRIHWEAGVIGQVLYLEAEAAGLRGTGIGCFFDDALHELLGLKGAAWQDIYHFTVGGAIDDPRITSSPPYEHLGNIRTKS